MASTGNPNNQVGGVSGGSTGPFDMNKFFNPANLHAQNPSNLGTSAYSQSPFYGPPTPSASYPPPAGPFSHPPQTPPFLQPPYSTDQRSASFPAPPIHPTPSAPPQNPNPGARLMALLGTPPTNFEYSPQPTAPFPPIQPSSGVSELQVPSAVPILPPVQPNAISHTSPLRMPSSKIPKGRHLSGDRVVYDVDVRLQGEVQPQLEVSPITKYNSDPGLILGHQIAVNETYISYGLNQGNIRVLNINTAGRYLLRGHTQRVTDMAFFAKDVHLLASASIDGRIYVWKISEGPCPDEEDKQQISGNVVIAIHIVGEEGSVRPRVCWHCHKQEILVVAIGNRVMKIDATKIDKGEVFSAEEPLKCPLEKLIKGVQLIGKHDEEVTDLSMCQWMTTRLVSASKDGTIKIWDDRKPQPLLVLKPHDGQPVDAAIFLTSPHRSDHVILITAGPHNREVKLWVSSSEEGWLLPSDSESWQCIQTLELTSSAEPRNEEAFFNQVVGLSEVGLLLLANAKRNAIYAIHLEYGDKPAVTRMDYLSEFTVTMPILSFTGTSDELPHVGHVVQVYCVQTQAIQQYALELSQCLPPPLDSFALEKSDSIGSHATEGVSTLEQSGNKVFDMALASFEPNPIIPDSTPEIKRAVSSTSESVILQESNALNRDYNPAASQPVTDHTDVSVGSSPVPISPRLSGKLSDRPVDQVVGDYSVDRQIDNTQTIRHKLPYTDSEKGNAQADINSHLKFKHPTHLITPSEIMATSSSETTRLVEGKSEVVSKIQDIIVSNDTRNVELEVKVVDATGYVKDDSSSPQAEPQIMMDRKEKIFCSQASDLGFETSRECYVVPKEDSIIEEAQSSSIMEALEQPSNSGEEAHDTVNDISRTSTDFCASGSVPPSPAPTSKPKKQKGKSTQASGPGLSAVSAYGSADSLGDTGVTSGVPAIEAASLQIASMQEVMRQLLAGQKEMNKQMAMMAMVPAKEGKRLEASLGRSIEKFGKANTDALWARIQDETVKLDKLIRERTQQISSLVTNCFNKDLIPILDKTLKKEMAAVGTNVARTVAPVIEKNISSAITESFQKGVSEKAFSQLERTVNSRVEAIIARQIQAQFQTSGKQALQEGLKSVLEMNIIPAFEISCKAMFEQVDTAFQRGIAEHITTAQHQVESANSSLAMTLRETINSASSISQSLSGELAEQRRILALAVAGPGSKTGLSFPSHTNGPLDGLHEKVEQLFDPKKDLSRLISEHKYEEAFTTALQRSDVSIVSWLCSQVELQRLLSNNPVPLSQGVLLSLLQQLACDITKEPSRKLQWMTDVAAAINPLDPMIAVHVRPIFEQVYQILNNHRSLPTTSVTEISSIRLIMLVINSMLMTCK